jgi:hypothetical protein
MFTPHGFYASEFDRGTGRYFSWTQHTAELDFPNLDRSIAYLVTLQLRGGRPAEVPRPELRVSVDGGLRYASEVESPPSRVEFEIPRSSGVGAVIVLDASPTYAPGAPDPRALGVIVDDVAVAPVNGRFHSATSVMITLGLAVMLCVWGLWICGFRGALAASVFALVTLGFVWLLLQDAAFVGSYADRLLRISLGAAALAAVVGALHGRWPALAGGPDWSIAAGLVIAAGVIRLGVFWHPLAIVGDAMFQVHRAQLVHAGSYFFTSVTPRPFFEFPYPVALFVAAQPLWSWFPTEPDLVRLLRLVSLVADAMVGLALYGAAWRQWHDRRIALFAAALWPFARAPFEAMTNANLTNLFGQGMFGTGLAGVAWLAASSGTSWLALAAIGVLLLVAFLSHFGTVTVGVAILGTVVVALIGFGRSHVRRVGLWILAVTMAAAAVAWTAYYSHPSFIAVYQKTYASVTATERDDSSKIVAAPIVKLQRWWSGTGDDYGRPGAVVLVVALAGLIMALRERPLGGATLVFAAWVAAWLALSAMGILTPVTLRANMAVAPAVMIFCGVALGRLANRSPAWRAAALALFAIIAWDGWTIALHCLDLTGAN